MSRIDAFKARVEKSLHSGKDLATLVGIVQKVQRLTSDPSTSSHDLSRIISSDTVLTSKVLILVNSAVFGLERRISSIDEAIVIVGYNQIRGLCSALLASSMADAAPGASGINAKDLWKHSLATAQACHTLQKRFLPGEDCDMFTTGLLANVGRMILNQRFTEDYERALAMAAEKNCSLMDAEREVFGVTHAEVGFWVCELWRFDETLAHTIRHHHGPSSTKHVDVLNLAYVITQALSVGSPGDRVLAHLIPGLYKRLNIDDMLLDQVLTDLSTAYKKLDPIFSYAG